MYLKKEQFVYPLFIKKSLHFPNRTVTLKPNHRNHYNPNKHVNLKRNMIMELHEAYFVCQSTSKMMFLIRTIALRIVAGSFGVQGITIFKS